VTVSTRVLTARAAQRPPDQLLRDAEDYLRRTGPLGAERSWLVEQISHLGHQPHRVSVTLSLLVANGLAQAGVGDNGVSTVTWRSR
jgi:hypothetical protein